MEKRFEKIKLNTGVTGMEAKKDGIHVTLKAEEGETSTDPDLRPRAGGHRPPPQRQDCSALEAAGVAVDERGFIPVDKQMRTNVPHIFAIGDIVGQPMLAHKAVHEGKVAAEVIAGHKVEFQALAIPRWPTPTRKWPGWASPRRKPRRKGSRSAKAPSPGPQRPRPVHRPRRGHDQAHPGQGTGRVIGAGLVGINAGELLAEAVLAIEMGATAEDIGLTIHAHPTLSETICFAAEMAEGTITDLLPPRRK
jgi:dihydrolipoamide dehydrogenase